MTLKQVRRYEMLVRVREFGKAHQELFPEGSVGGQALVAIAASVEQLDRHAASRMAATRETRRTKRAAREAILRRLDAIGRTARVIAEHMEGFADPFGPWRGRLTDQALVTWARLFVKQAAGVQDQFVAHGLRPAFLEDLTAAVHRFTQILAALDDAAAERTAARAGIEAAFAAGLGAVRTLEVVVTNRVQDDPTTVALWQRARRVGGSARVRATVPAGVAAPEATAAPAEVAPAAEAALEVAS